VPQHGQVVRLGSASARPLRLVSLRLVRARLAALGFSERLDSPRGERLAHLAPCATISGARVSRLQRFRPPPPLTRRTLAFLLFLTGFCLLGDSHNHGYLLLRVSDEVRCVHTWMGVGLWVGGWMGGVVYGQRHRSASSLYQCNLPQARAAQVLLRADLARRHTSRTNPPAERETDNLLRL
jgi:hypothetical protein